MLEAIGSGGGGVKAKNAPTPPPPKPSPPAPPSKPIAYNPGAYVPGGASKAVATAIQKKGVLEPGPHPVPVPPSVAISVGVPIARTTPYVPITPPPPPPQQPPPTVTPPPATPSLSHAELEALWTLAGGIPGTEDVAAAIAQAESGGCQYDLAGPVDIRPVKTCRWTHTDGENSCGFWQINLRAHPTYSAPSIFDKLTNAKAAVAISRGGLDFTPWTTYTNGAYRAYLQAGTPPPAGTSSPPSGPAATPVPAGIGKAWTSCLQVYTVKAPQQHDQVKKIADSLVTIFQ